MRPITVTVGPGTPPLTSRPIRLDEWANEGVGVQVSITGAATFTVQHSFDDPNDLTSPVPIASMFWDSGLIPPGGVSGSVGATFSISTAPLWMRLVLNAGAGSAKMIVTQYNVTNP